MRDRWTRVAVLTGLLFVLNAAARLVVWKAGIVKESDQTRIGLVTFVLLALVCLGFAALWSHQRRLPRVIGDLLVAGLAGCALSVLVGPFFGGSAPFREGFAFFLAQILQYVVIVGLGSFLGILACVAFGWDRKTLDWKRYENRQKSKPRKVVKG